MIAPNFRKPESTIGVVAKEHAKFKADYQYTRDSRFNRTRTGLAPQGGSGDYHIRNFYDFYRGIEKARDMDRNDAVIGQGITSATDNIVQDGFTLDFNTGDAAIDKDLKERFLYETADAERLDIAGEMCWHDFEWYACRHMLVDGDCGIAALANEDKLQFFEAHSIWRERGNSSDNVINGVRLDAFRRRTHYYVAMDSTNAYQTSRRDSAEMPTYDSDGIRQFFHVYKPNRTTLTRGITSLAPCFDIAGMFEDIQFAKLVQQQMVSCIAFLRQKQFGASGGTPPTTVAGGRYGNERTETTAYGGTRIIDGISPGIELEAPAGETLEGFSPNIPNAEYFDQATMIMRMISVNLGMPLMMLLLDGSDSTFHGYRGALLEARRGFVQNQNSLAKRLHNPYTRWKINRWIYDDPFIYEASRKSNIDLFNFTWSGSGFPYVDPEVDARAESFQAKNMLNSPRRIQANHNRDIKDIQRETLEDNAHAIQEAIKLADTLNSSNDGMDISWRDILPLPPADGVNVNQSQQQDAKNSITPKEATANGQI